MGDSGLEVSPFCLGAVSDPATVLAAYDAGINFFFLTADMHWPNYESLRQGLKMLFARDSNARDNVVVSVVSYVTQPEFCFMPFLEVLDEVSGLARIDVTVMGGVYSNEFLTRLSSYSRHRTEGYGKIPGARAVGASFHDRAAGAHAARYGVIDLAFVRYNPTHPGARHDLFPHLKVDSPTLVYNFKSMGGWLKPERYDELGIPATAWRPHATDYYRFALSTTGIDGVLCALTHPDQVGDLVTALERGPLTEAQSDYLLKLAELDSGDAVIA